MKTIILSIIVFCTACGISSQKHTKEIPIERNPVLDSLYKDAKLYGVEFISTFNCTNEFKKATNQITTNCVSTIRGNTFGYSIKMTDTTNNFDTADYTPTDQFKFDSAYIHFNSKVANITLLPYFNSEEQSAPVIVWYEPSFGPCAQYYQLSDRKVLLVRGLNFYCNGSNCTNFKIILIQETKGMETSAAILDFPGIYPFDFENIRLFSHKSNESPSIYIVKSGMNGTQTSDFEIIKLDDLFANSRKTLKLYE
ncbi:hypothetical protein ACQKLP_05935 [Chitinophaga sp. NPDC101104]|uniref:hypothetical protein n=1 Tax=Chitinophaga sp. NPDC101104 TaxID=3390561 RepID=UPI003D051584